MEGWHWIAFSLAAFALVLYVAREDRGKSMYKEADPGGTWSDWLHDWFILIAAIIGIGLYLWFTRKNR